MRQQTITIYKFNELPDSVKENARSWYRQNQEFHWSDESLQSIYTFCDHFGIRITQISVSPYSTPDYDADYFNSHFRCLRLRDFQRDFMPTGYCLDCDLWQTFYDEFKRTSSAKKAFDAALWAGFKAWRDDMEHQCSDEYIDKHLEINEYEFDEFGNFYR